MVTLNLCGAESKKNPYTLDFIYGVNFDFNNYNISEFYNLNVTKYFHKNYGVRAGIEQLNIGIRGKLYSMPLYFIYKIGSPRNFYDQNNNYQQNYNAYDVVSRTMENLLLGKLPVEAQINAGINMGYIYPKSTGFAVDSMGIIKDNGFSIQNHFFLSFDVGCRMMLPVWRFGFMMGVNTVWIVTQNRFFPKDAPNRDNYEPNYLIQLLIGLSYQF